MSRSPASAMAASAAVTPLAATVLVAASLHGAAAPAPAAAAPIPPPAGSVRLSDERAFTRWAHPVQGDSIRKQPAPEAVPVAPVRLITEDGYPEVYLLLRRWTDPDGRAWLQVRVPSRRKGTTGWVPATALGSATLVRTQLVVDRRRLRATLFRAGRRAWRSPVGIGKRKTPTPPGRFWIRELIRSTNPRGAYGPIAFGTSAYSRLSDWPGGGVIGIHGTDQPELIPGRPSHGCIRIPNRAIRRLARLMPVGTPVWVR